MEVLTIVPFGGGTASVAGSNTEIQYNDNGSLGASADLTWDDTGKELGVGGDINLDSGGAYSTTLQMVTATANRTISFPDATGTVALVSGSNGTVQYNEGGVLKGNSDFTVDPDWNDASTVFTGLKLNVTDTASAAGSNLLDLQANGTSRVVATATGNVGIGTTSPGSPLHVKGSNIRLEEASGTRTLDIYPAIFGGTHRFTSATSGAGYSFENNTGTLVTIDVSGRLLVGTSSAPTAATTLVLKGNSGSSATQGRIHIQRSGVPGNGDFMGDITFMDTSDGQAGRIGVARDGGTWTAGSSTPGRLVFSTTADGASSPTEQMRITSDRYVRLASGTGGIQFNGDTAAANALDDYEEGTWSPVYTPSSGSFATMTMNVQSARYTKIGNLVTAETYLVTSNVDVTGASGSVNITGLPFTSYSAQSLRRSGAIGYSTGFNGFPVSWAIQDNTTTINLYEASADALDVADLRTGAGSLNIIWLSVSYIAA